MQVRDIYSKNAETIRGDASLREAARKMTERKVGSLVIVNPDGTPHGMITDRDICIQFGRVPNAENLSVAEVMTSPVVSIRDTAKLDLALRCMSFGMRRVPVVNRENQLVGIVALDDFLLSYVNEIDQIGCLLRKEHPQAAAGQVNCNDSPN